MKHTVNYQEKRELETMAYQCKQTRERQAHQAWEIQKRALWQEINLKVEALDQWYKKLHWTEQAKVDREYFKQRDTLIRLRVTREEELRQAWWAETQAAETEWNEKIEQIEQAWRRHCQQEDEAKRQQHQAQDEQRRQQYRAYEQQYEREQEYSRQGHQQQTRQTTTQTEPPADFKMLWKAYNKRFHPNLFFNHPCYSQIEELCKQVNVAYDNRRPDFPGFLCHIIIQAEKLVAA